MNIRKSAKQRARHQPRYRVTFEPDYDHEAWRNDTVPTSQSHPDAFYTHHELVNPRPTNPTTRKAPHETLSIGALKKRLYRAGIRGSRAAAIAREIHAGPGLDALIAGGVTVMGWPVKALEERYGKRLTRAITRFVRTKFIMVDEAWSLLGSGAMSDFMQRSFQTMRKHNSKPLDASQDYNALVLSKPGSGMSFFNTGDNSNTVAFTQSGKGMSFILEASK